MDAKAFKDQDAFEEHKMRGFQRLVAGLKRVGFALPARVPDMVRVMEVE
eukprot:gene31066-50885_t